MRKIFRHPPSLIITTLALLRKLGKKPSDIEIDITTEVVVAQKLLGVAGNETTE